VFQTANGTERIYVMPFDVKSVVAIKFPNLREEQKKVKFLRTKILKKKQSSRTNMFKIVAGVDKFLVYPAMIVPF
jgi:hypothetical protein